MSMALYTKSIEKPIESRDGYRICIMRNPKGYGGYNEWIPQLSPTQELRDRVKQGMGWDQFKTEFEKYLQTQAKAIDCVAQEALQRDVTLLCVEDSPERCHRSLVANTIKAKYPNLNITIN